MFWGRPEKIQADLPQNPTATLNVRQKEMKLIYGHNTSYYPLTTAIGFNLATFFEIPAP